MLDVNFFQGVKFPAQSHSDSSIIAAVVVTRASSGELMFCLFLAASEERKQALD